MHGSRSRRLSTAAVRIVAVMVLPLGAVLSAAPAVADPGTAPVACSVERVEAAVAAGLAAWSVSCSAPRNVWVGVDYYSDSPHSDGWSQWVDSGGSWSDSRDIPLDPPLRQICVTVLESGRWVIGHTCDRV